MDMNEGKFFLFCFVVYEIHQTRMLQIHVPGVFGKLSTGGVHGLGSINVWTCSAKVVKY
jgi:hypothetical protein